MIERKKKILKATAASSLLILIIEPYDSNDAGKLWVRRRAGGYKKNKKRGRPRTRRITNTGSEFQDGGRVKKRSAMLVVVVVTAPVMHAQTLLL